MRCARYSPVPGPQRGWRPPPLVAAAVRRHAAHTAAPDPVEDARTVGPARFACGAVYRLALHGPIAPGARSRSAGWLGGLGARFIALRCRGRSRGAPGAGPRDGWGGWGRLAMFAMWFAPISRFAGQPGPRTIWPGHRLTTA